MDNFKAVYTILSQLEKDMDKPECDIEKIDHEQLGITYLRWAHYLEMMADVGYVKGVTIKKNIYDDFNVNTEELRITLKGLEYLQENSMMQKAYKAVKGIKEVLPIPGM